MATPGDLACRRRERAEAMDDRLRSAFSAACGGLVDGLSLVAVGGYGRQEMSPASDVDVVLVHDRAVKGERVRHVAEALWYPLWDDAVPLDHAVREAEEMVAAAGSDLRVALGMLDARHVTGDERLTAAARTRVLAEWRRTAGERLQELRRACDARAERAGEVAHAAIPDLKESRGGLRDGVVLRALVATWLVDVPHREAESCRAIVLDVRDVLHEVTGRRSDRLSPDLAPDVAQRLGRDPQSLTVALRDAGRRTAHLLDSTWRRLDSVVRQAPEPQPVSPSRRTPGRRPEIRPLTSTADAETGAGVGRVGDEVVLTSAARPDSDPLLALRAAALAAEQGLMLSRASAHRLARTTRKLPEPWPPAARRWLIRLLASGPGLLPVWEELDQAGVVDAWLPEWGRIRLRSSSAAVHRWTVDRHSVQTVVNAAAAMRRVSRPDLLVVAALLHDIGKGRRVDHSVLGARLAGRICARWGFDQADADQVGLLVRHHLLLPSVATRRDLEDPATVAVVTDRMPDSTTLDLLAVLTECDALATGGAAWSRWRSGLVRDLTSVSRRQLTAPVAPIRAGGMPSSPLGPALDGARLRIDVISSAEDETRLQIMAPDRLGLLADVAGGLALAGLPVRGGQAWTTPDGTAVSWWDLPVADVNTGRLGTRLRQLLDGSAQLRSRLAVDVASGAGPPVVQVAHGASFTATVVEVRAQDRRGLLWAVCDVFARHRVDVRTAHLDTLGSQTYDVFYLVDPAGAALSAAAADDVVADIERL